MAKFRVCFNIEKCKGCELCVHFCPKKILAIDAGVTNAKGYHPACITDQESCIGCATCGLMCPDCCITVFKEDEQ